MYYSKSSRPLDAEVPCFPLPKTKEEFEALTYVQRLALLQTNPGVYKRLAIPEQRKPWEPGGEM